MGTQAGWESGGINRRRAMQLAAGAVLGVALGTDPAGAAARNASGGSAKKGFPIGTKTDGYKAILADLRVAWYYNWGPKCANPAGKKFEFVPMMWKIYPQLDEICPELKAKKARGELAHLMGFNEPDHQGQSNLTVEQCLKNWPKLMQTGLRLVSPGAAWMWGNWMRDFMAGVKKNNYRVDAISVHWYGNPDPKEFLGRIRSAYELYKKPLWITASSRSWRSSTSWNDMRGLAGQAPATT